MTARKTPKAKTPDKEAAPNPNGLQLQERDGVSDGHMKAEIIFHSLSRHAFTGSAFGGQLFGDKDGVTINDGVAVLTEACHKTRGGDLSLQRDALTAQSMTLDGMFTKLARRALMHMGTNLDATDRYLRLAMKAQAQSRATIESLDRLVRGGEQVVRHIHVDNRGGQAMIAETINTGGHENGKAVGQPYAIKGRAPALGQPLRSANPEREAMPVAGDA